MSDQFKFHKSAIQWRREVVLQKLSQGFSQSEIAKELQLHPSTISLDVQWIREHSRENLKSFIENKLPEEVEKAFTSYDSIIKTAWQTAENTKDDRTRLQALHEVRETRAAKMDLVSNVDIINHVMNMGKDKEVKAKEEEDIDVTDDDEVIEEDPNVSRE